MCNVLSKAEPPAGPQKFDFGFADVTFSKISAQNRVANLQNSTPRTNRFSQTKRKMNSFHIEIIYFCCTITNEFMNHEHYLKNSSKTNPKSYPLETSLECKFLVQRYYS